MRSWFSVSRLFAVVIELPGVVYIVPYAVKSPLHSSDGWEECVYHPDYKDSILLSESLSSFNLLPIYPSDFLTDKKLHHAAKECDKNYSHEINRADMAVDYCFHCYSDCKAQCHCPQVEREVAELCQTVHERWCVFSYSPCQYQRADQKREYFADYQLKCRYKSHIGKRMGNRQ